MCVCVCVCVCLSVWYVILEHEDKNVRAELISRVLATIKTPIHNSQSKLSFHMQRSLKHNIIYTCGRNLNLKTGTVDGEADTETVHVHFPSFV